MKNERILLIGALNLGGRPTGGEEYKNRILERFLEKNYKLKVIDTHKWRGRPLVIASLLYQIIFGFSGVIIISASSLSSYRLIRFLHLFPEKLAKTIYLVIGGYFPDGISTGRYNKEFYQGLKSIVVEGELLKKSLVNSGLRDNVTVIPNFKPVPGLYASNVQSEQPGMKFVFISSVCKSKGVDLILDAAKQLLAKGYSSFGIDFWGPVDLDYQDIFLSKLTELSGNCAYRGYLDILSDSDNSYQILSQYDCMLFPTIYEGEGFPGVVLDAFIAGLPVIASDWNMNAEVISSGVSGYIIPPGSSEELAKIMAEIILKPAMVRNLKKNCNDTALVYDSDNVLNTHLVKLIESD